MCTSRKPSDCQAHLLSWRTERTGQGPSGGLNELAVRWGEVRSGKIFGSWSYCLPNSSSSSLVLSEKKKAVLWYKTNCAAGSLGRCQGSLAKSNIRWWRERGLQVWVARARSSSWSLARLLWLQGQIYSCQAGVWKKQSTLSNRKWNLRIGLLHSRGGCKLLCFCHPL